jgi:hypothetical protein
LKYMIFRTGLAAAFAAIALPGSELATLRMDARD